MDLPFSLLKVNHRVRNKAPMAGTCTCANPSGIPILSVEVGSIHGTVVMAGTSLAWWLKKCLWDIRYLVCACLISLLSVRCRLYGSSFTMYPRPSAKSTSSSGFRIFTWSAWKLPSVTIERRKSHLVRTLLATTVFADLNHSLLMWVILPIWWQINTRLGTGCTENG